MGARLDRVLAQLGFQRRSDYVSAQWLKDQDRQERPVFHGVSWSWPVQKIKDEHGRFNRERLRRRA